MRFGCQGPQLVPWTTRTTRTTPCRALPRFVARCPCWKSPHQRDLQRLFQQVPQQFHNSSFGKNNKKPPDISRFNMPKHFWRCQTFLGTSWDRKQGPRQNGIPKTVELFQIISSFLSAPVTLLGPGNELFFFLSDFHNLCTLWLWNHFHLWHLLNPPLDVQGQWMHRPRQICLDFPHSPLLPCLQPALSHCVAAQSPIEFQISDTVLHNYAYLCIHEPHEGTISIITMYRWEHKLRSCVGISDMVWRAAPTVDISVCWHIEPMPPKDLPNRLRRFWPSSAVAFCWRPEIQVGKKNTKKPTQGKLRP